MEQESTYTVLRQIRTDLRLSMDGVVAASMRAKGINYRLIFGVNIPRLKEISKKYRPDKTLAEVLWKENVRELKILATMLYPADGMSKETAERWGAGIDNQEIREQICRNIFQEVAFADQLVGGWTESEDESTRTTGYWLFARLCIVRSETAARISKPLLLRHAAEDLKSESLLLRQSALNVLKFLGQSSKEHAAEVLQSVELLEGINEISKSEMLDLLRFEFEYTD
ncbi:MAG: DNA alkylation repair protein [Porphyromonadaceae bacterium]|nr:DNA alkylation repair protein [Porphyromonadaceae bacterium]